ncbi:type II secretion system protein [Hydrogenimonas sp.]
MPKSIPSPAFTMIELIFVIVILGILTTVAIPKLVAIRDDAVVSAYAQQIMAGASEISAYATSKVKTENNLSQMSNSVSTLEKRGDLAIDVNNKKGVIKVGDIADCITIQVVSDTNEENLSISFADPNNDYLCEQLQNIIPQEKYPMRLRGKYVIR